MLKRVFDILVSSCVLIAVSPLLVLGALGVRLSSPGPIFYCARRAGRNGTPFPMYKFRSMHIGSDKGSAITAPGDTRVFRFGAFIRKVKVDELPQFFNILRGDMSIVGPRPEDVKIVEKHYADWMRETLHVRPGVTSPGAIFGYTRGDEYLDPDDPEGSYIERQMPVKLAIERAYIARATLLRDIGVCFRTVWAIIAMVLGRGYDVDPSLRADAAQWCPEAPYLNTGLKDLP